MPIREPAFGLPTVCRDVLMMADNCLSENGEKMKKLLLLGGSYQQIIAIENARRLGFETILCDYLPDNPGQFYADRFYQISTTDKNSILETAAKENVDGIIAYASDPAAPTAAFVAEKLNLPTNSYNSVSILCDKNKFRKFLKSNDFCVPNSVTINDDNLQDIDLSILKLPIIVKPADSSGSKGVTVLYSLNGIREAVEKALPFSRKKEIIAEEYIENKYEYVFGGDIFVINGEIVQWGIMDCIRDHSVSSLVPSGKRYPCSASSEDFNSIKKELDKLVKKLNIKHGPMNVELIVDKKNNTYIIDAGPRNGGNLIPELLEMIFKTNLVECSILQAAGEKVDIINDYDGRYYMSYNIHSSEEGKLKQIEISRDLAGHIVKKNIYKKPGDYVFPFINASEVIGVILMVFDREDEMNEALSNIKDLVKVELEN